MKEKKEKKGNSQSKSGRKQNEKKGNSQSKDRRKRKKGGRKEGKKAPDQGSKENRRNVQRGLWTGQYLNNTELSPNEQKKGRKGNHDLKWSSPFNYQPKSRALATLFSRPALNKKKQKKKKPGKSKAKNT